MANRERGEVEITIGGTVYTLSLGFTAMAAAEGALSTPQKEVTFKEITSAVDRGRTTELHVLIWAVFQKHHRNVTLSDVDDLVAEAGVDLFAQKIKELVALIAPDPRDLEQLGVRVSPNPPVAQTAPNRGTGGRSTSKPAARV